MHASRPLGGGPSAHIWAKQLLSASASVALPENPPIGQPGHVSWPPYPAQLPAELCGALLSASCFAPMSEHVSSDADPRVTGSSMTVARYILSVSMQI